MMKNRFTYILGALLLSACTSEDVVNNTLSEDGQKTPLSVTAAISASDAKPVTRAANKEFEASDELIAYFRHVTWNGANDGARTLVEADKSPLLVTFTKGSTDMTAYSGSEITPIGTGVALGLTSTNTQQATDLTADPTLYWDDFSNSASADTDLRTEGHYLQSFYGYCYNGGTPSSTLTESTGVLGWTVATNQTSGIQSSDLLWSAEQTPVRYDHNTDREGLILPYTHAMSKVTIEVVLDEGFDTYENGKAKAFGTNATTPTLYANRVTTTTAPTYIHSTTVASGDDAKIQMYLSDDEVTANKTRVYEAVIAPTVMKAGNLLAQITVDGNKYDIKLTDAVLSTVPDGSTTAAWKSQLKGYNISSTTLTKVTPETAYSTTDGGITLPGVNYRIKVTLKKQKIDVTAYLTDWTDVNASINGEIMFDADVVTSINTEGTEVTSTSFDLWRSTTNANAASYDADEDNTGIQKASTYTYTSGKWVGDPVLYWKNGSTPYYFRALAKVADPANKPNDITSVNGDQSAEQGTDLLWAQTSKHKGKDAAGIIIQEGGQDKEYAAGDPIDPRTGNVPLTFMHAMSKISVILKTNEGDSKVNLSGAKVSVINLYNGGTINISTGFMEDLTSPIDTDPSADPRTIKDLTVNSEYKLLNQIVIPQSLVNDKDGNARSTTPTFYQTSELTKIYNDDTSLPAGGGTGTYYLTSSLDNVNYADSELTKIYSDGTSIDKGGAFETYVTSTLEPVAATAAVKYTQEEADEENAKHLVADSNGHAPKDEGYETTYEDGYTAVTTETDRIPAVPEHYKVKADSKKATTSTFKCYKKSSSSEQHTPGELRTAGNKIMLYVTLTDGTRYSIELSKCLDTNGDAVTKWERGEHYTYEITLGKEEIVFRALIKDWVDKTGSGNATLDWD